MAISKKLKQIGDGPAMPDAASFLKIIDDGLADPLAVSRAYQQAMQDWKRAGGRVELDPRDVVAERPVITKADRETPEARMTMLGRISMFKADAR